MATTTYDVTQFECPSASHRQHHHLVPKTIESVGLRVMRCTYCARTANQIGEQINADLIASLKQEVTR